MPPVDIELDYRNGYPVLVNPEREAALVREAATTVVGPERVKTLKPTLGGEDFASTWSASPVASTASDRGIINKGCRRISTCLPLTSTSASCPSAPGCTPKWRNDSSQPELKASQEIIEQSMAKRLGIGALHPSF